jgi:hypothetical protein
MSDDTDNEVIPCVNHPHLMRGETVVIADLILVLKEQRQ